MSRLLLRLLTVVSLPVCLLGCGGGDDISVYNAPKPAEAPAIEPRPGPVMTGEAEPTQMIAAIIPQGEEAWFFKVDGNPAAVTPLMKPFLELVKSVEFGDDGDATWDTPDGWTQQAGNQIRFATLQTGDEEVSVTRLPIFGDDLDEYILSNVNRWRGQVNLPPMDQADLHQGGDLNEETRLLTLGDGTEVTLVNFSGVKAGGTSVPPFAGTGRTPPSGRPAAPARQTSTSSELNFDVPEGWRPGETNSFRKASFVVGQGEQQAEVTAIDLPAAANDPIPNINRWRGQVGLDRLDAAEVEKEIRSIDIDGSTGQYVSLVGPEDRSPRKAILGVIVERGNKAWFFKLTGPADLALRQQANFEKFVRSIRFSGE
ncbi:hypothetical protein [Stratiformator vulcanicus]|uniref:Uncharacterized protein n=1 Tax=Stratiformator vulcanicus TaxID=2527980 RepID=A0A517R509_9PLAN|nr:hypothetical protein [Stratiformator vulcanicus]QDT38964.1 hypothetical protein Pan189_33640 [Stratiformator vulcanicus]